MHECYRTSLKDVCLDSGSQRRDNSKYYDYNGVIPTTTFKNDRYLISFNQINGDLITGYKMRLKAIEKFEKTNQIVGKIWINKWSK